jgi:predicted GH43/DUF377 family glycosyl hydrolase
MPGDVDRAWSIIEKVMRLSEEQASDTLMLILTNFSKRHRNITKVFEKHFENLRWVFEHKGCDPDTVPLKTSMVIGAYFTNEYSIESAAFFNPSIVEDPYQGDLMEGRKRVIVSFRGTGEGHISSIAFRSGIIDRQGNMEFEEKGPVVEEPEIVKRHVYQKRTFLTDLEELSIPQSIISMVMQKLDEEFIYGKLQEALEECLRQPDLTADDRRDIQAINWLASSHYEITFSLDTALSERVIFPISYAETKGIEDARFVRFTDDDGSVVYYATYTAYDGRTILPKLLETKDFYHFSIRPLHGECVRNKGMALFPRKIDGRYAMISRLDGINNYIMFSNAIHLWREAQVIQQPVQPWELVQVGNAGSPIETERGWLVVTHGVGPMRRYSLGAILLDRNDPTRVIGRLKEPLLVPSEKERDGYVPNVVYSCGALGHNGNLIIPYAMSDYASGFACVPLEELLDALAP